MATLEEFRKSGAAFKGVTKEVFDQAQKLNELGIDPNRIFVGGSSAGGHLTGMMLAGGWREERGLPEALIKGAISFSCLLIFYYYHFILIDYPLKNMELFVLNMFL